MGENLTELFVNDLYKLTEKNFPAEINLKAKKSLLDYLGVTFAGTIIQKNKIQKLINYLGEDEKGSKVIGLNKKTSLTNAAFLNGLNSHVAELDDGIRFGGIHPGSPIISALLPLAEKENINGINIIRGIIIGYEAAIRLAQSIQPSHYNNGYHPTGTCGTIGAVVAIGVVLGFSKTEMKNALSAAANIASGTLKVIEDDSDLKPFNVGNASKSSLLSAFMARAGFSGPNDIFSGNSGFFQIMSNNVDLSYLEKDKSDKYCIEKVYFKPYAACRHCHAAIEASLEIKSNFKIKIKEIKKIKVYTYNYVLGKHDHTYIQGISSAKMSIPYSIAVSLFTGKAGIDQFGLKYVKDKELLSLAKKVEVYGKDEYSALVPEKRIAVVEIMTNDGVKYKEKVDFPKGEPENPLSNEEIKNKFISLATYGNKSRKEAEEIIEYVWNLENDMEKLFNLL